MGKGDVMSREGRKGGRKNWIRKLASLFLGFSHLCRIYMLGCPWKCTFCYLNKKGVHLSLESTTENMHFFHGCSLCIRAMEV